jgi:hypothetical protein
MVLILRPFDNKVISVSRKKVHCHEKMYAKFDVGFQTRPRIEFKDFTLDREEVDAAIEEARLHPIAQPNLKAQHRKVVQQIEHIDNKNHLMQELLNKNVNENMTVETTEEVSIPDHVLSVKVLSDFKRNMKLNSTQVDPIPEHLQDVFNSPQPDPGENFEIPDPFKLKKDLLLEEIEKFKKWIGEQNLTDRIIKALGVIAGDATNQAP